MTDRRPSYLAALRGHRRTKAYCSIQYDGEADALYVDVRPGERRVRTDSYGPKGRDGNILLDFGEDGQVVGFEFLSVSAIKEWLDFGPCPND